MSKEKTGSEQFAFIVAAISMTAALTIYRGYIAGILWVWFAVPLGAPAVGIAHLVGLFTLAAMFNHRNKSDRKSTGEMTDIVGYGLEAAVYSSMLLLVGYIATIYI